MDGLPYTQEKAFRLKNFRQHVFPERRIIEIRKLVLNRSSFIRSGMFRKTAPARFPIPKIFVLVFYAILATTLCWAGSAPSNPVESSEDNTREDETRASKIIQTFLRQGNALSDQSDPNGAIDNFGRALLLDLWSQSALENLILMSAREHLPAAKKAQIFHVEAIRKFMENLKGKIDYFAARRDELKDQLVQVGHTQAFLEHNLADVKNRFWGPRESIPDNPAPQDPLSAVVISLDIEKEWLASELGYIQKQYEWLLHAQYSPVSLAHRWDLWLILPYIQPGSL